VKKDNHARMKRTTEAIASSGATEAPSKVVDRHDATIDQPELTEKMPHTLTRVARDGNCMIVPKAATSEDFTFYQENGLGCSSTWGI